MDKPGAGPVVAGIDGSASALDAARWAAAVAHRREVTLRLVHGFEVPAVAEGVGAALRDQAARRLTDAAASINAAFPALSVETVACQAHPAAALLRETAGAELVVIGARGAGGFDRLRLGSTAAAITAHAECPVAVVRGSAPGPAAPVVVGVDGPGASEEAIDVAFDVASSRRAPLLAVHTWRETSIEGTWRPYPMSFDPADIDEDEYRMLTLQLGRWQEKYPDVDVRPVVVRGKPGPVLLDYAAGAQLVVAGSRGAGGFAGLLLGSTSQTLIQHAPCPVLIARTGANPAS